MVNWTIKGSRKVHFYDVYIRHWLFSVIANLNEWIALFPTTSEMKYNKTQPPNICSNSYVLDVCICQWLLRLELYDVYISQWWIKMHLCCTAWLFSFILAWRYIHHWLSTVFICCALWLKIGLRKFRGIQRVNQKYLWHVLILRT